MPTIKVRIAPDGSKVSVGVEGVAGESCTSLTEGLEAAVLGSGAERELTEEYYQEPNIGVEERI